ncbi:hypothetical protein KSS87_011790, partial [Heliosperma pusillum]
FYKWFTDLEAAMKSEVSFGVRLDMFIYGILIFISHVLMEKQRLIEFADALRSKLNYFDELENVHEAIRNSGGNKFSVSEAVEASFIYVRFKAVASELRGIVQQRISEFSKKEALPSLTRSGLHSPHPPSSPTPQPSTLIQATTTTTSRSTTLLPLTLTTQHSSNLQPPHVTQTTPISSTKSTPASTDTFLATKTPTTLVAPPRHNHTGGNGSTVRVVLAVVGDWVVHGSSHSSAITAKVGILGRGDKRHQYGVDIRTTSST